jgi:hypothetical protein
MEDRVTEFFVTAARNIREALQQRLGLARHQLWNDFFVQSGEQIRIAGEVAAVEQRNCELDIGGIKAVAFLQNAGSRTHLQAEIPKALRKVADSILESLLSLPIGVKKKQIDIRMGEQPIASESGQRDQGEIPWTSFLGTDYFGPEMESNLLHQRSPLYKGRAAISGRSKLLVDSG